MTIDNKQLTIDNKQLTIDNEQLTIMVSLRDEFEFIIDSFSKKTP